VCVCVSESRFPRSRRSLGVEIGRVVQKAGRASLVVWVELRERSVLTGFRYYPVAAIIANEMNLHGWHEAPNGRTDEAL
jgi:hypothetical protein